MGIKDLLNEARGEEPRRTGWLAAAIEAERSRPLETVDFEIQVGDVLAPVVVTELRGDEWAEIASTIPRTGNTEDARLNCNTDQLLAAYPVDRVLIGGEHPTVEEWRELLEVISAPTRGEIVAALWWIHWGLPLERRAKAKTKQEEGAV